MAVGLLSRFFKSGSPELHNDFARQVVAMQEIAKVFASFCGTSSPSDRGALMLEIKEQVEKSEHVVKHFKKQLANNYLTPFDREDMLQLSVALHHVSDTFYGAIKRGSNHNLDTADGSFYDIANTLLLVVKELGSMVNSLKDHKTIVTLEVNIHQTSQLISRCDQFIDTSIQSEPADDMELIKRNDFLYMLEAILERCGDVMKVMETYVVKYQ